MSIHSKKEFQRLLHCIAEGANDEAKSLLQQRGNPCDLAGDSESTLLHYSVQHDNAVMVQHLLEGGFAVDARDGDRFTPLMLAVKYMRVACVEVLVKNNADIYETVITLQSALDPMFPRTSHLRRQSYQAILNVISNKLNADFLMDRGTVISRLTADNPAKLAAVVLGDSELAKFVLESDYPPDFQEPKYGCIALHCAIVLGKIENAKMLIAYGASASLPDAKGFPPMYYYGLCTIVYKNTFECFDKELEVLKSLIKATRIDSLVRYSRLGWTMKCAVEQLLETGNKEVVRTVLMSDIHVLSERALLHLLIENENVEVLDLFAELDIEFNANEHYSSGTVLILAVKDICLRKVEFLLQHGADVNCTTSGFNTPLFYTVGLVRALREEKKEKERAKITELLLQHGANAQCVLKNKKILAVHLSQHDLSTKVTIAHLALIGTFDQSPLTDDSRKNIQSDVGLKAQFDMCTQQLEGMKEIQVYGTVTLFKLLSEGEDKLAIYARNQEFILAFNSIMENTCNIEPYYFNTLQKRIAHTVEKVELYKKAAAAIETLTGLCKDTYQVILSNENN